jgi:hypothetical protein
VGAEWNDVAWGFERVDWLSAEHAFDTERTRECLWDCWLYGRH